MRKVVVTGGAGFIGSNLVDELIDNGLEVIVIDNLSTGKKENLNTGATFFQHDLSCINIDDLVDIFESVDVVFHLAALARVQPSIEDPLPYHDANVTATLNILYASTKANVKRVVYSASSSCYGNATKVPQNEKDETNPLSPYGLQKYIGEQYCRMFSEVYKLDTVSLRYFNVYGERMSLSGAYCLVTGIFARQMQNNQSLTITNDGNQRRDFTYVGDVVSANMLASRYEKKLNGEVFNIGNGKNFSIHEVADMFGGKKMYGEKRLEPFETLADNRKAKNILKWSPKGNLRAWIKKYKIELGI
ncbi:MAG: NAD-dependent dehydratase [Flavobacteriales bacterium]|nr:NAD-dependent dehydratase [Flavobacteriales bacterium]|tara:strand:- start:240 stop:1148 length:909 start_codon:yes stop_codon:yes gene_type:complete